MAKRNGVISDFRLSLYCGPTLVNTVADLLAGKDGVSAVLSGTERVYFTIRMNSNGDGVRQQALDTLASHGIRCGWTWRDVAVLGADSPKPCCDGVTFHSSNCPEVR